MESEMDLQLMLLPAVVTGDPSANNNNNNNNTNNKMVVNCRDEEAEYLERLLTEKKIVDSTAGLDLTQKLINAGKLLHTNVKLILVPTDSITTTILTLIRRNKVAPRELFHFK
jgi:hypothetical protein